MLGGVGWLAAACSPGSAPSPSPVPTNTPAVGPSPAVTMTPTTFHPPELPEKDRVLKAVKSVKQVAKLVGKDSINHTDEKWGVDGTDLGSMFDKDGKMYIVFGDTFGCCIPGTGGPGNATDWRYNVMAVSSDRDPSDGLTFDTMITDAPDHAKQLLSKMLGDKTIIPTNGVAVGKQMFLHYMAVLAWGDPGKWVLSESGLAVSDDDGQTWNKKSGVKWAGNSNFGQVAFAKNQEDLYLYGIPGGRFGGVKLARVPQSTVLEQAAYRYYSGSNGDGPVWSEKEEDAVTIVPAPVGELSVLWNAYLGRWIMTYLDESQAAIMIREAPEMWGPWSAAQPLVSSQGFPGLYGAFMHPWYVEEEGKVIYFTMSQWGPYAVFWMRAELEKGS